MKYKIDERSRQNVRAVVVGLLDLGCRLEKKGTFQLDGRPKRIKQFENGAELEMEVSITLVARDVLVGSYRFMIKKVFSKYSAAK